MNRKRKKEKSTENRFFYGWIVVGIAALGVFFSGPGQTYGVSVFIDHYIKEFGWSRSFISSLYSTGTLVAGFLLFAIGHCIDWLGHRRMIPLIAFSFGLACLWMSIVLHPAMLLGGFFLIRLLGQGSMTLSSNTLVPQWFEAKRGRALSFMALGSALSASVLPPLNTYIIENYGWRFGWQFWAVLLIFFMAPLALVLIRNKPEDIGLLPDGKKNKKPLNAEEALQEENKYWTVGEARQTRTFWLLLFCMFVPSMVNTGITFHLISILGEHGISPIVAASVLSTMALVVLPMSFVAGYILDKVITHHLLALVFIMHFIMVLCLLFVQKPWMAFLFGGFWGGIVAFESMTFNYVWPSYYGRKNLGSIRGFAMVCTVIGSAFGPLPFGIAYDLFHGYNEIILLMALFPFLAIFSSFLAVRPQKSMVKAVASTEM